MMGVSAKFKVSRITPYGPFEIKDGKLSGDCEMAEVELTPDYAQGRNAEWSKATPAGVIRMTITNPAALEQFGLNDAFTVLFEKEEEPAPA
jgi:hypothetical protein